MRTTGPEAGRSIPNNVGHVDETTVAGLERPVEAIEPARCVDCVARWYYRLQPCVGCHEAHEETS